MRLLVVFLFGSHLLYPKSRRSSASSRAAAAQADGRTARLSRARPVVVAGALVVLAGGALHAGFASRTADDAFRYAETAAFRRRTGAVGPAVPLDGARGRVARPGRPESAGPSRSRAERPPDLRAVSLAVFWNDRPLGEWRSPRRAGSGSSCRPRSGVLRVEVSETFRPSARGLAPVGIEVGHLTP